MENLNASKHHNNKINLKKKRIDELLDSCSEEVIKQITGSFGLTPDMFKDRDGGNVTTNHNFEKGIVANEEDKARYNQYMKNINNPIDRTNYDKELPKMRKKLFQQKVGIIDAYTGKKLPRDGRTHLDHVTPVKQFETDPRKILNMSIDERIALANENIVPCNSSMNLSMQDSDKSEWANRKNRKNKEKTNAEYYEVDMEKLTKIKMKANINIEYNLMKKTAIKQGREVISTGIDEAKKNALNQMMGIFFYEFVNGIYIEMKKIFKDRNLRENKIDRLIEACKDIANNICGKVKEMGEALVDGGIQGFLSNFITYAINLIWTTSARIVKIIRESMSALWKAVKIWWTDDSTPTEKARKIIKIIISIISVGLGVMLHETVKSFIMSIPIFLPIAEELSVAITAIITGIMTAIAVYGIDSFFDWLNSTGTEKLEDRIEILKDNVDVANHMIVNLDNQFKNSQKYILCKKGYERIEQYMKSSLDALEKTSQSYCKINIDNKKMIDFMSDSIKKELEFEKQLKELGIEG